MIRKILAAAALVIGFMAWVLWPRPLEIDFLAVGQGDSILVQHGRIQMLIDGGPDRTVLSGLGRKLPFGDRTIEYMVLTHPHADHFVGLIAVLARYRVEHIVMTRAASDSPIYPEFLRAAAAEGAEIRYAAEGDRIDLEPGAHFDVLAADSVHDGDLNDSSIVMKLTTEQGSALLTGDAGAPLEEKLLANNASLRADILKVGHHGSRFSTGDAFVQAVRPRFAAIEVGKNTYGHPAFAVVRRLEAAGARVFRTDRNGDVRAVFSAGGISMSGAH